MVSIDTYLAQLKGVGGAGQGPAVPPGGVDFAALFGLSAEQAAAAQQLMGQINPDTDQPYSAFEAYAGLSGVFGTGPFAEKPQQFAPPAPPTFSGTPAGLRLQGALDMARQGLIGEQELAGIAAQAANDLQLAGFNNEAAMARQIAGDREAMRRAMAGEVGAGARAELGELGASQRALFGEMGAGARSQMEMGGARNRTLLDLMGQGAMTQMRTGTTRAIAAGQNVSDTFGRMAEMAASPSDFLKLAYNVQGMRPMADTPTDIARQEMQKFYGTQTTLANAPQQTFGSIFQPMRQTVGADPTFASIFNPMRQTVGGLPSYGDLFQRARGQIGGFQFGGEPKSGAAITGERGKPELVTGANLKVTPNLSKTEIRALRLGGVGGKQFGGNVFDIESLKPGYDAPLFSGDFGKMAAGGKGAVTGLEGLDPLDFSVQNVNRMLPFEQQMLMGRFGESIIDPKTGAVLRAGMDPSSVLEMIRRSSWVGGAPSMSRWG